MTTKTTKLSIAAAAALAIFTGTVSAHAADIRPVKQVDVSMLNLATPQGLDHAKVLLRQAARSVCFTEATVEPSARSAQKKCYQTAVADAYAKVATLRMAQASGRQGQRLASVDVASGRAAH